MIVLKSETQTTRLTICKYETYQDMRHADETHLKRKRNACETHLTPIEEGKERKEGKELLLLENETKKENPLFSANLIGYFKNEKVLEFYETNPVDLFISVSSSEGIPVSIMEAVSRGIPSVATNVGGTSELITPELGGSWLLPPKVSPEDIANLLTLIKRQEWHITERDKAFYLWENRFDATKNYSIFAKWLIGFQESKTIEGVVPE